MKFSRPYKAILARRLRRHSHCKPSPAEQNRTDQNRAAWVVRSSTDAPFIPLRLSWQRTQFCPLRVALDASRRVALVVRTELRFRRITLVASRSLWGTYYIHDVSCRDWPETLGSIHTASRAEPNMNRTPVLSRTVGKEGLFTCRAKHVVSSISVM